MKAIELLAPARNADIGIAAINCGADAVYIAGPAFGARKNASNPISEIERLCAYASRFAVRVFVTFNILIDDNEIEEVHALMLACQKAGASAFIIRDPRLCMFTDIVIPFHASTQCSIRDVSRARLFESAGCSRIVLERELPLDTIRDICLSVKCEVECFVHGALCVCYSGVCALSEKLTGRSADRGECVQACRNLYDLEDADGNVIGRNKAYLSLKDLNLSDNLESLLDAGVTSLKIEGRLKNASYVSNVVREYSLKLDEIIHRRSHDFCRSSAGHVEGGFIPSLSKTFNRSYTALFWDESPLWANSTAPKSMGEEIGTVLSISKKTRDLMEIKVMTEVKDLQNGDGFAFVRGSEIVGFRGDICSGNVILCKAVGGLKEGAVLYRNYSSAFEKQLEVEKCHRMISVKVSYHSEMGDDGLLKCVFSAVSEDGREVKDHLNNCEPAYNASREEVIYKSQIGKHASDYVFELAEIEGVLAHLSISTLNSIRRNLSKMLDALPCRGEKMLNVPWRKSVKYETSRRSGELMRSKYCLRRELGCCLKDKGSEPKQLFLVNNGRRFPLRFDCSVCEMALLEP